MITALQVDNSPKYDFAEPCSYSTLKSAGPKFPTHPTLSVCSALRSQPSTRPRSTSCGVLTRLELWLVSFLTFLY